MEIEGMPVVDSRRKVIVNVTKSDIKRGSRKKPEACAVALACMRELNVDEALVHATRTYLRKGLKWTRYFTPNAVRSETIAFDRGGAFEPGKYELHPVPPTLRFGAFAERYASKDVRKSAGVKKVATGKKRSKRHVTANVRSKPGYHGDVKTPWYKSVYGARNESK